jgi:tetratricopeptide (TPR) repeat protein
VSRTSVLQYKDSPRPIAAVAGELGVATVVTGSVRRSGGRIRVVAQVVDARREDHLWAETYDREIENVFGVQSEVAAQVANAVQRELSPTDRSSIELRGTSDPQAYDLFLRARFLWNLRNEAAVGDSVELFRRALDRDPGFALAQTGLADAYTVLGIYGARAPADVFPAAKEAASAALTVDPAMGEAVASRACVAAVFDWDWSHAEEEFLRAIELAPSHATAYQWYAMNVLAPQARFDDAEVELARARELDPASFAISVSEGIVSLYSRHYAEAVDTLEALEERHPRFALVHYFLAQCHVAEGRADKALEHAQKAVELSDRSPESLAAHGFVLGTVGRQDEAEAVLARLSNLAERRYVSQVLAAQVLIGLGRGDEALTRLARAQDERATDLIWLGVRPMYDGLRDSDRFAVVLSSLGLENS